MSKTHNEHMIISHYGQVNKKPGLAAAGTVCDSYARAFDLWLGRIKHYPQLEHVWVKDVKETEFQKICFQMEQNRGTPQWLRRAAEGIE